jgi:hypothetical protein
VIPDYGFKLCFPVITDVKHFFIYLLATCISCIEKYYSYLSLIIKYVFIYLFGLLLVLQSWGGETQGLVHSGQGLYPRAALLSYNFF